MKKSNDSAGILSKRVIATRHTKIKKCDNPKSSNGDSTGSVITYS